jgi:cation diffusion facilitator family transporter
MKCNNCSNCKSRVGWVGLFISILMGTFMISVGLLNNSKALVAASLCSGIDVVSALTVLLGLKFSDKPISLRYPYGYGKIESLVVGVMSMLLITSAVILLIHSAISIYMGDPGPDQWMTLAAALVAAAVNEVKYRYAHCVGKHTNRPAIKSQAEHARIDVVSSAAVAVAVICAKIGLHFVDPLIAIFEIGHIFKASLKMLKGGMSNLMDASVAPEKVAELELLVSDVDGVVDINYILARDIGHVVWIQVSVFIDANLTVEEAKNISENVKIKIGAYSGSIGNVDVHFLAHAA